MTARRLSVARRMLNGFASYIIPHASAAADAVVESRRRASRLSRASGARARRRLAGLGSSSEAVRCYGWSRGEHGDGRGGSHAGGREVEGLQFVAHGELGVHTALAVVARSHAGVPSHFACNVSCSACTWCLLPRIMTSLLNRMVSAHKLLNM